jgi:hypothetical protein
LYQALNQLTRRLAQAPLQRQYRKRHEGEIFLSRRHCFCTISVCNRQALVHVRGHDDTRGSGNKTVTIGWISGQPPNESRAIFLCVKQLAVYLNDHLAGSVAALELLDDLIKDQTGQRVEKFLVDLRADIHSDQEVLSDLIQKLDLGESAVGKAGAWIAEKLGRAKFTGVGEQSGDLGLMQALEGLALGITGKELLWRALQTVEANLSQLQGIDLKRLQQRAREQFERVEKERLHLAREALATP